MTGRYYVRINGGSAVKAKEIFGACVENAVKYEGNIAFITEEISEADFEAKIKDLDVLSKIRVYD